MKWIPCNEFLPGVKETNGVMSAKVLFSTTHGEVKCGDFVIGLNVAFYDDASYDPDNLDYDTYALNDVIAWMPLPQPYTEETNA